MSSSSLQQQYYQECDSKRIDRVYLLQAKKTFGVRWYHIAFGLCYVPLLILLISSIGQPYRDFLTKADREGFAVMEGTTKLRAQLERSMMDVDNPDRRIKKLGWLAWMEYDIEELVEEKKRDRERSILDSLPKDQRVPSKYAPSFFPTLSFGIAVVLHILLVLLQHWSVAFGVYMNYRVLDLDNNDGLRRLLKRSHLMNEEEAEEGKVTKHVEAPTHVRVVPSYREGSPPARHVVLPLTFSPTLGWTFEYHRRRYLFYPTTPLGPANVDSDDIVTWIWKKIRCRTDWPLKELGTYQGYLYESQITQGTVRYGPNQFQVSQPKFMELYRRQLVSPFTVFQLFCVILWMLDAYWQYSAFTLFMILTFEATVVFSKLKSLQAVRGMGNPTRQIYVYRHANWSQVQTTEELLPGDICSLTLDRYHYKEAGHVVPADLLLLYEGSTVVVNEASLTGESVPQMKEGLHEFEEQSDDPQAAALDIKGRHKPNVVYAGTQMLQCQRIMEHKDNNNDDDNNKTGTRPPPPPDGGVPALVLRTGFASSQGKLVRMMEGSQEKVKGHEKETGLLLLLLFCFALASATYVLTHAQASRRSRYELLLHCILIVTSVIPPELPMQMALAVNNSLMTLMKMHVFCTEPFRVPMAGKLQACLFDKTGTLTTDELVAVGVCEPQNLKQSGETLKGMTKIIHEAALVLAGCHSLIMVQDDDDDKDNAATAATANNSSSTDNKQQPQLPHWTMTGDPLEQAAVRAMRWTILQRHGDNQSQQQAPPMVIPAEATKYVPAGKTFTVATNHQNVSGIVILTRHAFSSKLQRMSCVVQVHPQKNTHFALVKGSPEAIGSLLSNKPEGYDDKAHYLSKQGYRVLALAYKSLGPNPEPARESRLVCESDLTFAGFIAFTCRVRKDTANVLTRLRQGGMSIAMVTGDALLTAIHVAKEVGIVRPKNADEAENDEQEQNEETNQELKALLESKNANHPNDANNNSAKNGKEQTKQAEVEPILILNDENKKLTWQSYETGDYMQDFVANDIPTLASQYALATTGKCLAKALEYQEDTKSMLGYFKVFARMTPDAKETVIECLHSIGSLCLMCGDGANDVGALKQADVGVALLSGFGNLNVDKGEDAADKKKQQEAAKEGEITPAVSAIMSREHLEAIRALPVGLLKMKLRSLGVEPNKYPQLVEKEDLVKLYQIKAREIAVKRHDEKNKGKLTRAEKAAKQREELAEKQRRVAQRTQELEAQGVQWASFQAMKELWQEEMKSKKAEAMKTRGIEGSAAAMAAKLEDMETGELPMVKLGDASIAAPFTSKMPSIKSCVDIVRQGRCTLVSSIQMYQILALQCLISSYSLSVLYLDGVKYGDTQMTAMGMLGSVSFMSVSRSKPLDRLSRVRPLVSIFHPSLFLSLLGQFAVHMSTMMIAVYYAKQHLPPDYEADLDGEFKPGILNTVVFLVSNVQQVTVFVVNLQGRPFMSGLTENRPLLYSLVVTFILTFMFASETVPGLNRYFQLVPFPDEAFRDFLLQLLMCDVFLTLTLDRIMKFVFCRDILMASIEGTTWKDISGLVQTVVVIFMIMYMFLGNDEQWEIMLAQQEALENATTANITQANDSLVLDDVAECVGAACEAVASAAAAAVGQEQGLHDEF